MGRLQARVLVSSAASSAVAREVEELLLGLGGRARVELEVELALGRQARAVGVLQLGPEGREQRVARLGRERRVDWGLVEELELVRLAVSGA